MKRILITLACTAVVLTGCIQDEVLDSGRTSGTDAVEFGTYLGRSAATRATVVTSETLESEGFGVMAWYTGLDYFSADNVAEYDVFMNNTRVAHDGTMWAYDPLKYWPNNPGDMVSFVAYAPHMVDAEGNTDPNIAVSGTNLSYTVPNEVKEQLDLLWSDTSEYATIDLTKQAVDEKVLFFFRHALSKISFKVGALIDEVENDTTDGELGSETLAPETVIKVKRIVLMGDESYSDTEGWLTEGGPFYTGGQLNLVDGSWSDMAAGQRFEFTAAEHFIVDAENEFVLNQNNSNYLNELLNDESHLMIIPQDFTSDGFRIYVEYDVITEDAAASDGSVIVENKITSADAVTSINFEQGKQYNINMILGMTTVKFDVEVTDWLTADDENSDNPLNTGSVSTNPLMLNYNRMNMTVGDTGQILATNIPSGLATKSMGSLSYTSDSEEVITVDYEGNVEALMAGTATVTVSYEGYDDALCVIDVLPVIKNVTLEDPIETSKIPAADVVWKMGRLSEYSLDNPTHFVKLTKDYYMGQYEVNRGQFLQFLNANTECFKNDGGNIVFEYYSEGTLMNEILCDKTLNDFEAAADGWQLSNDTGKWPVRTSWAGAHMFAQSVGGSLPSEAHWEYACRAGSNDLDEWYWWQDELLDDYYYKYFFETSDVSLENQITEFEKKVLAYENLEKYLEVNKKTGNEDSDGNPIYDTEQTLTGSLRAEGQTTYANSWGLYDLYGSVSELCSNFYYDYPVNEGEPGESASNPLIDPDGSNATDQATHTVRGGGLNGYYGLFMIDGEYSKTVLIQPFADSYYRNAAAHDYVDGFRVIFYDNLSSNNSVTKSDNVAPTSL